MEIEKLVVGQLQTNCYLAWDKSSGKGIVIDPGDDGDYLIRRIRDLEVKPKLIVATHGHFDHVLAVPELKLAFKIPFLMNKKDLFLLKRSAETAHYFTGRVAVPPLMPDKFIKQGDLIKFGKEKLKVIETPGHSPGGVALYSGPRHHSGSGTKEDTSEVKPGKIQDDTSEVVPGKHLRAETKEILFSGDTLFCQGVGRTDFSYGSAKDLEKSIKKLLKLPGKPCVYPGHGPETTVEREKG